MKRYIGLSGSINEKNNEVLSQFVNANYVDRIIQAGLLPVIIPYSINSHNAKDYLQGLSGIVFCGGNDICPEFYNSIPHEKLGETNKIRDLSEFALFNEALKMKLPILAICRGLQMINVALGGTLVQDIPSCIKSDLLHSKDNSNGADVCHSINIVKDSPAFNWFGQDEAVINSFHHQCIDKLGKGLIPCALSADNVIEAVYSQEYSNIIAVQWHPERQNNAASNNIFNEFARKCQAYGAKNNG